MCSIEGKRILMVAPRTFGLAEIISKRLQTLGAHVDFYCEYKNEKALFVSKQLKKYFRFSQVQFFKRYYDEIINSVRNSGKKYDALFVIRGEYLNIDFINRISTVAFGRNTSKGVKILYLWDSFKNLQNREIIEDAFDFRYSFDSEDCKNNCSYLFLPLFWYSTMCDNPEKEWDISLVGSFYDDRYERAKKIYHANNGLKQFIKLYISKKGAAWRSIFVYRNKDYFDPELITYKPIPREKMYEIVSRSKAVLDIHSIHQSGLTLRTIEAIGSNQKLVTTNQAVKDYDFYKYGNVFLVGEDNWKISNEWLQKSPVILPDTIRLKYSLDSWIRQIFSNI